MVRQSQITSSLKILQEKRKDKQHYFPMTVEVFRLNSCSMKSMSVHCNPLKSITGMCSYLTGFLRLRLGLGPSDQQQWDLFEMTLYKQAPV